MLKQLLIMMRHEVRNVCRTDHHVRRHVVDICKYPGKNESSWLPDDTSSRLKRFVRDQTRAGVANPRGVPHEHSQISG